MNVVINVYEESEMVEVGLDNAEYDDGYGDGYDEGYNDASESDKNKDNV